MLKGVPLGGHPSKNRRGLEVDESHEQDEEAQAPAEGVHDEGEPQNGHDRLQDGHAPDQRRGHHGQGKGRDRRNVGLHTERSEEHKEQNQRRPASIADQTSEFASGSSTCWNIRSLLVESGHLQFGMMCLTK